jgi:phosphopantothenoylcysteine synthetase/decarboxylase
MTTDRRSAGQELRNHDPVQVEEIVALCACEQAGDGRLEEARAVERVSGVALKRRNLAAGGVLLSSAGPTAEPFPTSSS